MAAGALLAFGQVGAASGPRSSTFANGKLNTSIWTNIIGQDSQMSLTKHAGWLTIPTETAGVVAFATQLHDMVLQPVSPTADWSVSVETTFYGIKFAPAGTLANYQGGGIVAWQGDLSWVRVWRAPSDCKLTLNYMTSAAKLTIVPMSPAAQAVVCNQQDDPLWLGLQKQGDTYTGYYSTDGKTYYPVGAATAVSSVQPTYVGVNAGEGTGTATPVDMGFKDFTAAALTVGAESTTSSSTSAASKSSISASSSRTTSSSTSASGTSSVPKTGNGPLPLLAGLVLIGAGLGGAWRLRRVARRD